MSYFIIAFIIFLLSIFIDRFNNSYLKVFAYIVILFCLISLAGLRGDVEPDYSNYQDIFYNAKNNINLDIEPVFFYFNKTVAYFGLDFQWIIFLIAIFSITLKINFFSKNSKNFAFSVLIYYCSMFFLYDFIAIRQALAMAFFMIAIPYLMERKFLPYLTFIVLASLIHLSASILIFLYFFIHISFKKSILYTLLVFSALVSILKIEINLVSKLLNFLFWPEFALNKLDIYVQEDEFSALSFRQLVLGFIFILFLSNKDDKIIKILLNIYIFGVLLATLFNEIPQLSFRLKAYFLWAESILVVYFVCKIFKNNNVLRILVYLVLTILYILSLYNYLDTLSIRQENYIYPYKLFFE